MKNKNAIGYLLKLERFKQNKGQKEVCYGICVPSYLSKIEHGTVNPDTEILHKLFERLGICYETDMTIMAALQEKIARYFYNMEYHLENNIYQELLGQKEQLDYSVCTIDWLLIQALEGVDTYELLSQCQEYMTLEQKGYYALVSFDRWLKFIPKNLEEEVQKKKMLLEKSQTAYDILKNAYTYNVLVLSYYLIGNYARVHQMESTLIGLAVKEGNTFALADYYMLDGSAYACLNMEEMMMQCYERSMKILQNTNWKGALQEVYYNIGATLISSCKYKEAMTYFDKLEKQDFAVLHKKALIMIRTGNMEQGKNFLKLAEQTSLNKPLSKSDELKIREAYMECEVGFLENEKYLDLLEELLKTLEQEKHFGHVYFYKDMVAAAYKAQRKYKKLCEFMQKIENMAQ